MSFTARNVKRYKSSRRDLAQSLLTATYSDDGLDILDFVDEIVMNENDKGVELQQLNKHLALSSQGDSDEDDRSESDDDHEHDDQGALISADEEVTTAALKQATSLEPMDGERNKDEPKYSRRTTAKPIIDEDLALSRKYEEILTIPPEDIIDKSDKIDALILQLKLAHIYTQPEDKQYEIIQERYQWIDDEDGEIDQFQYEEIQEVVNNMTEVERRHMYDTIQEGNDVKKFLTEEEEEEYELEREKYQLLPAALKTMRRYKKMAENDAQYVCSGCGVKLRYERGKKKKGKKSATLKKTKAWRGYFCPATQREFIFHNRLCVKFRKAKEFIRDAVHKYNVEHNLNAQSKMQIDFMKDEDLDDEFQPTQFFTTFDESKKKSVAFTKNIRQYYQECVNTDLRGYDIDEGDRFGDIPIAIKYLDMREFAIPMFRYLVREVSIKDFALFWQLIQFFTSYINTPKLIELLKQSSDVLFPLHDDTHSGDAAVNNPLIDFLTIICEGALYPIATCLYISAYITENGENYWNEDETESLSKHFRNMASSIIDEIESEHLVAIVLETPTNIYVDDADDADDDDDGDNQVGLSVIDIAIKYKMLKFLQNHKISRIATTLWYERKIVHPQKRFGDELTFFDLFRRLLKTPAKFYFSPAGLNIVRLGLYLTYLFVFSLVTFGRRYNYEQNKDYEYAVVLDDKVQPVWDVVEKGTTDLENILWLFNIAAIMYEFYKCFSGPRVYFARFENLNEFIKALIWIVLFVLKFVTPATCQDVDNFSYAATTSTSSATSTDMFTTDTFEQADFTCTDVELRNSLLTEVYMAFWSIQCVLFWLTLVFYLRRTRTTGPLLTIIGLMTQDMINFLLFVVLWWVAVSLAIYYVVSTDLQEYEYATENDSRKTLNELPACLFFGLKNMLGQQDWDTVNLTSPALGVPRSLMLDAITAATAVVGTVLLLNLLIAMLSSTFMAVSELSALEVNYIRIVQSYAASREISLIPPPLNYFAFILMSIWFIVDLLITACTARTKMLNDWFFTPLNRTVFSAGDFIEYEEFADGDILGKSDKHKKGTGMKSSGYVQHQYNSEVAQIKVANNVKFIHKTNILSIKKKVFTDRLSDADANGICASITSSGRYYCKYCRYYFHGDQVGNVEQVASLFKMHGILLDDDDTGKLSNMLGEGRSAKESTHKKRRRLKKRQNSEEEMGDRVRLQSNSTQTGEKKTDDFTQIDGDYEKNLRTYGVAQLCPECYRPFYCSEDRSDEVQRLQYLSEVCSFWVFMILLWLPLVIAFSIPALFSYIFNVLSGKESFFGGKKAKEEKALQKLAQKIKLSEDNNRYRANIVNSFDDIRPTLDYVFQITNAVNKVHKKIRESQADDEDDNIVTQTHEKIELKKLELTPEEGRKRMKVLRTMHQDWCERLDEVIQRIQKGKKKKKKSKRVQYFD